MDTPSAKQLLGLDDAHVVRLSPEAVLGTVSLHPAAAEAFLALRSEAARDGFDLRVVSGFRSFERQLLIWNAKARGERSLLDADERELDASSLSAEACVLAILRWSALPGASRHHWGSDFDVVDAAALAPGVAPSLCVAEFAAGGMFARLGQWLEERLDRAPDACFFRPYDGTGNGVAREPWHLSYAPLSARCEARFDPAQLRDLLASSGLALGETVDVLLEELIARFAQVDAARYPPSWRRLRAGLALA